MSPFRTNPLFRGLRLKTLLIAAAFLLLPGCAYYRVRDVGTGKEYITDNWHQYDYGRSFTDLKTGRLVTLSSSEKEVISGDEAQREIATGKN
jgi:hypothetical protein